MKRLISITPGNSTTIDGKFDDCLPQTAAAFGEVAEFFDKHLVK